MIHNLWPFCCVALLFVSGCALEKDELASIATLEGRWYDHGMTHRFYHADGKLFRTDTSEVVTGSYMLVSNNAIQLCRADGTSLEEPWHYQRHGDTIQFTPGSSPWVIVKMSPHVLVIRTEGPGQTPSFAAREAITMYNIR